MICIAKANEYFLRLTKICKIYISNWPSYLIKYVMTLYLALLSEMEFTKVSITDDRRLILYYIDILCFCMETILKSFTMTNGTKIDQV